VSESDRLDISEQTHLVEVKQFFQAHLSHLRRPMWAQYHQALRLEHAEGHRDHAGSEPICELIERKRLAHAKLTGENLRPKLHDNAIARSTRPRFRECPICGERRFNVLLARRPRGSIHPRDQTGTKSGFTLESPRR
jgi:hypothetical protein